MRSLKRKEGNIDILYKIRFRVVRNELMRSHSNNLLFTNIDNFLCKHKKNLNSE